MAREFRVRSASDYADMDRTITKTFVDDRVKANLTGMGIAEERMGVASDLYAMFQSRAIAWASR